jgi:hypothetical protein
MTRLLQPVMASALSARGLAALALGLSMVASPTFAQPAAHCLSVQPAGTRTVLKNVCPGPISVALCITAPDQGNSLMARVCGDGSPLNQYFTVPIELAPGESRTDEIPTPKTAVCNGPGAATGMGGFTSDPNGNFKCPPRPASAKLNTPGASTASNAEDQPKSTKPEPKNKPANCSALVKYRDTQLAKDLGFAIKNYKAASQSLELIAPLKKEVLEQKAKLPSVDTALKLTLALKTAANAIGDILGLSPVTETVTASAGKFAAVVLSKQTDLNVAVLTDDVDSWVQAEALGLIPGIGSALKASYNLYGNLTALKQAELDGKTVVLENAKNIESLEKLLRKQEAMLKSSDWRIKMVNEARAAIDQTCN